MALVAVLGASAYGIYASFLRPAAQEAAAKNLPDTTVVYVSIDLAAAANNSHHISFANLGQAAGSGSATSATGLGLNWQSDILPWIGPTATVAIVPGASGGAMSEIALLQSHDDAAASDAAAKYLAAQQQQGTTYTTTTYGGFSLHSASGNGTTIATGAGWVLVATNAVTVRTVVDRMNGKGATLASLAGFQQATSDLPADRFGTLYVNLHALASSAAAAAGSLTTAVLGVYPSAAGSLEWTTAGMRWQTTLHAAQGGFPSQSVAGATTTLATLVPASASAYVGIANLGGLVQSLAQLIAPTGQATPDPLKAALGIPASDAALQQPAAVAVLAGAAASATATKATASQTNGVLMIHVASDGDATRLLAALAQHSGWTMSATTVDGQSATELLSAGDASAPLATTGAALLTAPRASAQQGAASTQVVAVEAVVHNTMVIATSAANLQAVIETAKGSNASLATSAGFQKLVAGAPASSAASVFLNVAGLQQSLHVPAPAALQTQVTAALLTLTWTNTEVQTTLDTALSH